MQILAIVNQKGGTAKSTTAAAIAQAGQHKGLKVLAVDLDPQGNLSFFLQANTSKPGAYSVLEGQTTAAEAIQTVKGIDILAASPNLATVGSYRGSAFRLADQLAHVKGNYDLIVIDTLSTVGELQYNALMCATGLVIPLHADIVGVQGLLQILDTTKKIQESNTALKIKGLIFTQHNPRGTLTKQVQAKIEGIAIGCKLNILGAVRQGIAIQEAQALQENIFEYQPKAKPIADYMDIFNKIMEE